MDSTVELCTPVDGAPQAEDQGWEILSQMVGGDGTYL